MVPFDVSTRSHHGSLVKKPVKARQIIDPVEHLITGETCHAHSRALPTGTKCCIEEDAGLSYQDQKINVPEGSLRVQRDWY